MHTYCISTLFYIAARHQYSVKNQYFNRTYKLYYPYHCWLDLPFALSAIKEQQPLPVLHWKELALYVREVTVTNPLSSRPNKCPWAHVASSDSSIPQLTGSFVANLFGTCCCHQIQNMHIFTKIWKVDKVQRELCCLCLVVLKRIYHKKD